MDGMEDKLAAVLNNPQMMQQLMSMAQMLGSQQQKPETPPASPPAQPEWDFAMIQQFASLAKQSSIDAQQTALLKALSPYLSRERLNKLEKAMRAAKLAKIASIALGQRG